MRSTLAWACLAFTLACGPENNGSNLVPGAYSTPDATADASEWAAGEDTTAGEVSGVDDVVGDAGDLPGAADVAPGDAPELPSGDTQELPSNDLSEPVPDVPAGGDDTSSTPLDDVGGPDDPDTGGTDVPGDVDEPPPEDVVEEPDPTAGINGGWIGGACASVADCEYADATCVAAWPDGMCTQGCDLYCPDQAGSVTTFCIDAAALPVPGAGGMCTVRCDFNLSPTGCRPGYMCKSMPRHGQPTTEVLSCVPDDGGSTGVTDCIDELVARGVPFDVMANPGDHPEGHPELTCVIDQPVRIGPTIHGISLRYASPDANPGKVFVSCPAALAIEETLALLAPEGVTDVVHLGTYNCRVIAGTTKLSQHGLANAIDFAGARFDDGTYWTVLGQWEDGVPNPVTEAGKFLSWLAHALYDQWIWNIILTPEYNAAHDNHFHVDLTPGSHFLSE